MFLLPSELGFLRFLKVAKVPLNEYSFPKNKVANVQGQLEKLISSNYYLHQSALEGYRSYLQAYGSYSLKRIFDVHSLDLKAVGRAFGFKVPPKVNIGIGGSMKGGNHQSNGKRKEVDADEAQGEGGAEASEAANGNADESSSRPHLARRDYKKSKHSDKAVDRYRKADNAQRGMKKGGNWAR